MNTVPRLINTFIPTHYDLSLVIERTARTFAGTVTIEGTTPEGGDHISLHAKQLTIENVLVDGKAAEWSADEHDELKITHPDITPGDHIVVISFSGTITDPMHGLYPCYYSHDGKKKELLATQFESHHAREVFPCIDEPAAKATFDVTLTTETGVTALSNMPMKFQREEADKLVTVFETSPKMSVYLLAWVVGELHSISGTTKGGVDVSIWATPAQPAESLVFALDIATRTIDFYDEYFETPYPLPKSDHVALPDFSSGAMENWGLVTYRETTLLADPKTTSVSSKHYIATVIAHELAHQWFGNLVTMKWWDDLWLNESFATVMEYICIDALEPDWNMWLDFSSQESIMALRRDAVDGVQAVHVDVNHPDEISSLFDPAIVYAKGARLLRMLQKYVGDNDFRAGLKVYFAKHAYANTVGEDLWKALEDASGKPIRDMMHTWVSQPGYPVVEIDEHSLKQRQFFIGEHTDTGRMWPIPLETSDGSLPELFTDEKLDISVALGTRLNDGDSAHFITRYSESLLDAIMADLSNLPPLTRMQLLHEQTLLARTDELPSAELIPLLESYRSETTEHVWDMISLALGELKKFVETDEAAEIKLRQFAGNLARPQYERLGWDEIEGESESDIKLRATILSLMLYSEDTDVIAEALKRFKSVALTELPGELRSILLSTAVRHDGDEALINSLLETHRTTTSAELRDDIASGLTSTKSSKVIDQLLALLTDTETIRSQDTARWFVYLIRNRYGREKSWQWLVDNWDWIENTFAGDKSFDYFPRYAATGPVTREQLQAYKDFFIPKRDEPALTRVIDLGITEITSRVALIESDDEAVRLNLQKL